MGFGKREHSFKRLAVFSLISLIILAISIAAVVIGVFEVGRGGREEITIPYLVGRRIDDVTNDSKIVDGDKICIESELVFSSEAEEGIIISQSPYGGAKRKVAEGESYTLKVRVSLGRESGIIPELKNYRYNAAAAALRRIGARIRVVSVFDDTLEDDRVIRTSPSSGEKVKRGDLVTLFVARNHIHRPISVKDYVGLPLSVALADLLSEGLNLGSVTREYSDVFPKGAVISQSIRADSCVPYGSVIDLTLSLGRES